MKRSEINRAVQRAVELLGQEGLGCPHLDIGSWRIGNRTGTGWKSSGRPCWAGM